MPIKEEALSHHHVVTGQGPQEDRPSTDPPRLSFYILSGSVFSGVVGVVSASCVDGSSVSDDEEADCATVLVKESVEAVPPPPDDGGPGDELSLLLQPPNRRTMPTTFIQVSILMMAASLFSSPCGDPEATS